MIFANLQNWKGVWGFHRQADLYGIVPYKISACDLLRRSESHTCQESLKIAVFDNTRKGAEQKMPKTKFSRFEIRLTPEEKENLINNAAEAHMTVSKYIIYLSKSKRVLLKDDIAELTVEISRIGNNINQIAHIGNSQKFLYKTQINEVSKHLQEVVQMQKKILMAMFSDEEHTIITVEKKIDRMMERLDNLTERMNRIGGS